MTSRTNYIAIAWMCVASLGACAAPSHMRISAPSVRSAPASPELARSVFKKDPQGQLSEDDIQKILSSPLELEIPARVGILPIVEAADWRGPSPNYNIAPSAITAFSKKLRSPEAFTLVTEMMPIPSGALGMEALRNMAARYKLRYIVLYREHIAHDSDANGWAAFYATGIGALFVPGRTLRLSGYVEATLFDVKTGLLLFTTRRRVRASKRTNLWHKERKLAELGDKLANKVALKLAQDLKTSLFDFRTAVKVENKRIRDQATAASKSRKLPTTPAKNGAAASTKVM